MKTHRALYYAAAAIVFGLAVTLWWMFSTSGGNGKSADEYLRSATNLFYRGNSEKALELLEKAIELNPRNAEAWANKGVVLRKLGRLMESVTAHDRAIELKPDLVQAWYNKGVALYELNRFEEALEALDRATKIKPDFAEAWNNSGVTLDELQKYDEALKAFEKAVELAPEYAEAWHNRGATYAKLGRLRDAVTSYDNAVRHNPETQAPATTAPACSPCSAKKRKPLWTCQRQWNWTKDTRTSQRQTKTSNPSGATGNSKISSVSVPESTLISAFRPVRLPRLQMKHRGYCTITQ